MLEIQYYNKKYRIVGDFMADDDTALVLESYPYDHYNSALQAIIDLDFEWEKVKFEYVEQIMEER